jgi:hypothetical protein
VNFFNSFVILSVRSPKWILKGSSLNEGAILPAPLQRDILKRSDEVSRIPSGVINALKEKA